MLILSFFSVWEVTNINISDRYSKHSCIAIAPDKNGDIRILVFLFHHENMLVLIRSAKDTSNEYQNICFRRDRKKYQYFLAENALSGGMNEYPLHAIWEAVLENGFTMYKYTQIKRVVQQ